ncbi:hypothetical protein SFOMI_2343 [Sphingobium fuliginis]|uniref:Uncharacterized protein n=1 Tax=Sphingobium fuliginis (strain ATCC 27551) TaxID=336203 RepID=A0A292ZFZ3_SPHSA|nr:hypothetical protein SFOMI_2343 [Sphingobium fuliginis]
MTKAGKKRRAILIGHYAGSVEGSAPIRCTSCANRIIRRSRAGRPRQQRLRAGDFAAAATARLREMKRR